MKDARIDKRLHDIEDEVRLLSGYISDAVSESLDTRIAGLAKRIDSLQVSSGDGDRQTPQPFPDPEIFTAVRDDLTGLSDSIDARFAELGKRIESFQPQSIDPGEIAGQIPSHHDEFAAIQKELKTAAESIGTRLSEVSKQIEPLKQKDPDLKKLADQLPKHHETLASLHGELKSLAASIATANDAIGNTVTDSIARASEEYAGRLESLGGELKSLGESLPAIGRQVQSNSTAQAELQKSVTGSIGRIEKLLNTLSDDVSSHAETVKNSISRNGDAIMNTSQRLGQKQDESVAKLMKELQSLRENSEVIRRMCTTDEEKFLGSMTTVVYKRTTEMSGELTKLHNGMKKWFVSLDENHQRAAEKSLDRQDEIKKSLLFDINKIGETVQHLDSQVSHDRKRPIGSEIIRTSDRIAALDEIMPDIQGNVAAINEQLAQVSKEVRRMRWFVIAAVGISIAVLAASFFI